MIAERRGMSNVVSVISLVLLVLVASALLWSVVYQTLKPVPDELASMAGLVCDGIDLEILTADFSRGFSSQPDTLTVTVRRDAGGATISKMTFLVEGAPLAGQPDATGLVEFSTDPFTLSTPADFAKGQVDRDDKLEIAPVVTLDSGQEEQCGVKSQRVIA